MPASQIAKAAKATLSSPAAKSTLAAATGVVNSASKFATESLSSPAAKKSLAAASEALNSASKFASSSLNRLSSKASTTHYASYLDQVVFEGRVAKELVKEVWRKEQLSPPSLKQWDIARAQAVDAFQWRAIREMTFKDVALSGIIAAEVASFFIVGEMVGRWNMVGYAV